MQVSDFVRVIGADFYAGVPDSQLKALGNFLMHTYEPFGVHHVIAANEGNAAAIAAGYHLATGKIAAVYMQNSGEGNIINPAASLLSKKVYAIPVIFIIGWRGEPGVHDEPQHAFQGMVTLKLLEDMDIPYSVVEKGTTPEELEVARRLFDGVLAGGRQVAFVVKKDALTFDEKVTYKNKNSLTREEVIRHIVEVSGDDAIVSTTGKASRELFEIREARGEDHSRDFLTVGSMGHSSSIALGIALQRPNQKVWCIDGDGAAIMHLGALAVIGTTSPKNFIHVVINNGAHESVGGMPTAAAKLGLSALARAAGYASAETVEDAAALDAVLAKAKDTPGPSFIEVKCAIGSRSDLGRPTTTPQENKAAFMKHLESKHTRLDGTMMNESREFSR